MTYLFKLAKRLSFNHFGIWVLLLATGACADAVDPDDPTFQSSSIVAMRLWPQEPTIVLGDSIDFIAVGLTAAGDTVAALDVTWSAGGGEIKGNGKGRGRYRASAVGRNKVKAVKDSLSDSTTVTVTAAPVASVEVTPAAASVVQGRTVQLTATLRDANGNMLTGRAVSWTTNDADCATVNANGRVSGVGAGPATITATSEGKSAAGSVTVTEPSGSAVPGDVVDLAVVGQAETALTLALTEVDDGEGNPAGYAVRFAPSPISWGPAGGSEFVVAGVQVGATLEFQVTGLASGTQYDVQGVAFRGTLGQSPVFSQNLSNVATGVTQTNTASVASVEVTPATASVAQGSTVQLTATTKDAAGNVLTGRAVSWASSNTGVASVNSSGRVSGVAAGSATITATSEGQSGTAAVTVTAAPVASVSVTPSTASVYVGSTVQLTATPKDAAGNVLTGRAVSWSSSNTGVASVNSSGRVSGVAAGSATITATSEGQSGTAAVTVTVAPPPPPPGSGTFYVDSENSAASDNNPGTEAQPWKTLYKAAATLTAGQTVYVKAGTFDVRDQTDCSYSRPAIRPANSGTPEAPIAFRAYPGQRPVLISDNAHCPPIGTSHVDYIIIDGFEVIGRQIAVWNTIGSIVENNVVHGHHSSGADNTDGIRAENSDGIIIRHNVIYDIWNSEGSPNSGGYKSYDVSNAIIEYNEVYDTRSGVRNKRGGRNNTFRYNYIHDITGKAVWMQSGVEHKAHHNVAYRCQTGVDIDDIGSDPAPDNQAWNNTIVDCGTGLNTENSSAEFWNNLFYNVDDPIAASASYCDYNLYWLSPVECGGNSVNAAPMFMETDFNEASDVELRAGSPAIGAGRNGGNIGAR